LSAQLSARLGPASYEQVRDHVENLRFTDAALAIEAVAPLA
jgi:hypothetical protein